LPKTVRIGSDILLELELEEPEVLIVEHIERLAVSGSEGRNVTC
jgi:hypothetical protein